jgi:hypothetical protein
MSNSALVVHTNLSPNCSKPRNHAIDTITIHCVVGQCTAETLGNIFKPVERQASSNYGVDKDGRVGMYVEEINRSWCTSSSANDNRAITIEVASDTTTPYAVTAKAYAGLLDLVTDICQRNGIKKLLWQGDKNLIGQVDKQNLSVHRWFANKSCPGDYLYERHTAIAEEVNKRLGTVTPVEPVTPPAPTPTPSTGDIKAGTVVKLLAGATYYDGKAIPAWVAGQNWVVLSVKGDRAVIDKSETGANSICSPVNVKYLSAVNAVPAPAPAFRSYLVKVKADTLNIRKGPGINYSTNGVIKDKGTYTIVEESAGAGATKWGKLKSGAGWISLDYTTKI